MLRTSMTLALFIACASACEPEHHLVGIYGGTGGDGEGGGGEGGGGVDGGAGFGGFEEADAAAGFDSGAHRAGNPNFDAGRDGPPLVSPEATIPNDATDEALVPPPSVVDSGSGPEASMGGAAGQGGSQRDAGRAGASGGGGAAVGEMGGSGNASGFLGFGGSVIAMGGFGGEGANTLPGWVGVGPVGSTDQDAWIATCRSNSFYLACAFEDQACIAQCTSDPVETEVGESLCGSEGQACWDGRTCQTFIRGDGEKAGNLCSAL